MHKTRDVKCHRKRIVPHRILVLRLGQPEAEHIDQENREEGEQHQPVAT